MEKTKIYDATLDFTGVTDFGVSLDAILSGEAPVPPQGARVDVTFEGKSEGQLSGRVKGCDYLYIRADGRFELNIRATLETDDGHRISFDAKGLATPRANEPVADIEETATMLTAAEPYLWLNGRNVTGTGYVDLANGRVHVSVYA